MIPRTARKPVGVKDGSVWRDRTRWTASLEWMLGFYHLGPDGQWKYYRPTWWPRWWR